MFLNNVTQFLEAFDSITNVESILTIVLGTVVTIITAMIPLIKNNKPLSDALKAFVKIMSLQAKQNNQQCNEQDKKHKTSHDTHKEKKKTKKKS